MLTTPPRVLHYSSPQGLLASSNGPVTVVILTASTVALMLRAVTLEGGSIDTSTKTPSTTRGGYGVELCAAPGGPVRVLCVIPGSPADRCGRVFVGDTVLQIDQEATTGAPLTRVIDALAAAAASGRAVRLLLQADRSPLYPDLIDRERGRTRRTLLLSNVDARGIALGDGSAGDTPLNGGTSVGAGVVVTAAPTAVLAAGLQIGHMIVEVDGEDVTDAKAADVAILLSHGGYERRTIVVTETPQRRVSKIDLAFFLLRFFSVVERIRRLRTHSPTQNQSCVFHRLFDWFETLHYLVPKGLD